MQGPWRSCAQPAPLPLQQQPQGAAAAWLPLDWPRANPACRDSRERPVVLEEAGAEEVATDANKEGPVEPSTEVVLVVEAVLAAVDVTAGTNSSSCTSRAH